MSTALQKQSAQAIINIFETGKVLGDYASVVSVSGDPGGLTYGRSQTTLMSGNLFLLIKDYCTTVDASFSEDLASYLSQLSSQDAVLNSNKQIHTLLKEAGRNDPVMWQVQDGFFDRVFWNPAIKQAANLGIVSALGIAVVYDSVTHGSWERMRDRTTTKFSKTSDIGENQWIAHYIAVRRDWLATHPTVPLLHKTVYRMDAFKKLVDAGNWDLKLPFTVRSLLIDEETLMPQASASAMAEGVRLLKLQSPYMQGEDIRNVQKALRDKKLSIEVEGVYGPKTEEAVKTFQTRQGLRADGIVGPATLVELGL